jgi:integrase
LVLPDGTVEDRPCLVGLRDRALIGVMTYTVGRVGAVVAMRVEDYFANGKRWWIRLHEKGGKRHEMPAHHKLEAYLTTTSRPPRSRDKPSSPSSALLFLCARSRLSLVSPLPGAASVKLL